MIYFKNDYSEGAHPDILQALLETNLVQDEGYGDDQFCKEAADNIKRAMSYPDADIHFLSGGTQSNLLAISAFLRPHQAVISADTGHILVHEAGAIEATGHKVLSVPTTDGKLRPDDIRKVVLYHSDEHMVKPKMVYISQSTEVGSVYYKSDLQDLYAICQKFGLYLFMDGARLGSALCVKDQDLMLSDLPKFTDAFYIGGTKNGALLGEALVIVKDELKEDFRFHMKQKGALLAKGRLLGLQFRELFQNDLFFDLAKHANEMADLLRQGFQNAGYPFLSESPSNQIFPILPNSTIKKLQENYAFIVWGPVDDNHSAIRLVTSWATKEENIEKLLRNIRSPF